MVNNESANLRVGVVTILEVPLQSTTSDVMVIKFKSDKYHFYKKGSVFILFHPTIW